MLVLAFDTATPTLVAGVARWSAEGGVEVLAERGEPSGTRHAELLTPTIHGVLTEAGVRLAEVGALVVGLGPGPFTGLRVGVVTAAALADARGLPVVGVCSLDAVGDPLVARTVITDARRKEVYWAVYGAAGARVQGPDVLRPEELTVTGPAVGDARFAERLGVAVAPAEVTTAGLLAAAAPRLAEGPVPGKPLVPLYLRRPDAIPPTSTKPVSGR